MKIQVPTVGADLGVCPNGSEGEHATMGEHIGSPLVVIVDKEINDV